MGTGSVHAVQYLQLATFALLSVVAFVRWFRRHDPASAWLAATFFALTVPTSLGTWLAHHPGNPPPLWLVQGATVMLAAFPLFLFRFMLTFERSREWQQLLVYAIAASALILTLTVDPTDAARQRPVLAGITPYMGVLLLEFLVTVTVVAYHLRQAGLPLPSPARKRANLLAAGSATFGIAIVVGIATQNHPPSSLASHSVQWLVLLSSWLFLVGVTPPSALVRRWRRHDESEFREELVDIAFSGASPVELRTVMLPKLARLMGASRLDWMRPDGSLLATSGGQKLGNRDVRVNLPDGATLVIWTTAYTPFFASELGILGRTLGSMLHLTLERAAAQEVAAVARRDLEEAQRIAHIGNWNWDLGLGEMSWSAEMYRLHGLASTDNPPSIVQYLQIVHPDDRESVELITKKAFEAAEPYDAEYRVVIGDDVRWLQIKARVTASGAGDPIALFGTCQDVTERHDMQRRLTRMALHDELTGLPNRTLLTERLANAVNDPALAGTSTAVLFIDIDRFKVINDSLGHEAGDAVLVAVASRIQAALRPCDTVARFGGDELVVLCTEVRDRQHALEIADRIGAAASAPIVWNGKSLVVSLSIGVALSSVTGDDPRELMRDADAAMYVAKQSGRARAVLFEGNIRTEAVARLDTESELRLAMQRSEMRLAYQPLVSLDGGAIVGFESLLRWQHPQHGLVGPDRFLTVAEETGLIVPIGAWVVTESCRQLREWLDQFPILDDARISVNVAAQQLADPGFVAVVRQALALHRIDPPQLELEITERVFAADSPETDCTIAELSELGVRLSVDDFGVGYSSLGYLKRFPLQTLKIDRSFVAGIGRDADDAAIVRAILALADSLGLVTVAEGIESDGQCRTLQRMGCPEGQGWIFSRAVDAAAIDAMLTDRSGSTVSVSA